MIYLDNAATTRIRGEVLEAMLPYLKGGYGNPSALYALAREARRALDAARERVRAALGAEYASEIFFTAGGTESDNWALKGTVLANRDNGKHIITSKAEHHAILNACVSLEKQGYDVTYLDVDETGMVDPGSVRQSIRQDTVLISILWANNEVGTINPVAEIGRIAKERGILFHTDAVQAAGHLPIRLDDADIDLLSISGHKFHGPKGVGALYIKKGTKIENLLDGGAQEKGRRAGTENLASIVGMGRAIELAVRELPAESKRLAALRDFMIKEICTRIPYAKVNGSLTQRLPGNINVSFPGKRSESILFNLDTRGVACSGGAACTAGAAEKSHVLKAMGLSEAALESAVRFSFGRYTTREEVRQAVRILCGILG